MSPRFTVLAALLLVAAVLPVRADAGVTVDDTLGATAVALGGPAYIVDETHGVQQGGTFLVSLSDLSLATGDTLSIEPPSGTTHIVLRVTGSARSDIDGVIDADATQLEEVILLGFGGWSLTAGAGVTGPTDFTFASVGEVTFSGGTTFPAAGSYTGDVAEQTPSGFAFGGAIDHGTSVVGAELSPDDGHSLTIVGGTVLIDGGAELKVSQARLAIAGLRDGHISLGADGWDTSAANLAAVTVQGSASEVQVNGGEVLVAAGTLTISEALVESTSDGGGPDGNTPAGLLELAGNVIGISAATISNAVTGDRKAGLTTITATNELVIDGSTQIRSTSEAGGGGVRLDSDRMELTDVQITVLAQGAVGDEGDLEIVSRSFTANTLAVGLNDNSGLGADIRLTGENAVMQEDVFFSTSGENPDRAGHITIDFTGNLRVESLNDEIDTRLSLSTANTAGRGGDVTVDLGGNWEVNETSVRFQTAGADGPGAVVFEVGNFFTDTGDIRSVALGEVEPTGSISIDTNTFQLLDGSHVGVEFSDAPGGDLVIRAQVVTVIDQSAINSGPFDGGTGDGGDVTIESAEVQFSTSDVQLSAGAGQSGSLRIDATESIAIDDGTMISAGSDSAGGGGIVMLAGNVIGIINSDVHAIAAQAARGGGRLSVTADQVTVSNADIQARAESGAGAGMRFEGLDMAVEDGSLLSTCSANPDGSGDITFEFRDAVTFRRTTDEAEASTLETCNTGTGDAGQIRIDTARILYEDTPSFDTSAAEGVPGVVMTAGSGSSLIQVTRFEAGEAGCTSGGIRIESGHDDGRPGGTPGDGALQPEEVEQTTVVCDGTESVDSLIVTSAESPGANCADGGTRLDVGTDNGDGDDGVAENGVLETGEVDDTIYICDGVSSLIAVQREAAGENCENGGVRVDSGMDDGNGEGTAGDGTLHPDEVEATEFVCDAGATNGLVRTTPLDPGSDACPAGGVQIEVGVDDGDPGGSAGNGVLDDDEVESTTSVCRPESDGGSDAEGCHVSPGPQLPSSPLGWLALLGLAVLGLGRRRQL